MKKCSIIFLINVVILITLVTQANAQSKRISDEPIKSATVTKSGFVKIVTLRLGAVLKTNPNNIHIILDPSVKGTTVSATKLLWSEADKELYVTEVDIRVRTLSLKNNWNYKIVQAVKKFERSQTPRDVVPQ